MNLYELSLNDKFMMFDGAVTLTFKGMDGMFGKAVDDDNHLFFINAMEEVVKLSSTQTLNATAE